MELEIQEIALAKRDLSAAQAEEFDRHYDRHRRSPVTAQLLSLWGGILGLDRFYLGEKNVAILKAVTLGGLYVWALFDLFVIYNAAQEKNIKIIRGIHSTLVQTRTSS